MAKFGLYKIRMLPYLLRFCYLLSVFLKLPSLTIYRGLAYYTSLLKRKKTTLSIYSGLGTGTSKVAGLLSFFLSFFEEGTQQAAEAGRVSKR